MDQILGFFISFQIKLVMSVLVLFPELSKYFSCSQMTWESTQ